MDFGHSVFPQWIANQFLGSAMFVTHINKIRTELRLRRDEITSSLYDILNSKVDFCSPEGGIHLWCKIHEEVDEQKLLDESIKNGVVFVPGSILGTKKGYVRFTYGRGQLGQIHTGVERFYEAIVKMK